MDDYIDRKILLLKLSELGGCDAEPGTWAAGYDKAIDLVYDFVRGMPAADVEAVRHGHWIYEAHKGKANCRWNVTAECSECCDEKNEIWAGFFPGVPDCIAKDVAIDSAKTVKLSNFCPNCGARMEG